VVLETKCTAIGGCCSSGASLLSLDLYKWHESHVRLYLAILVRNAHNHPASVSILESFTMFPDQEPSKGTHNEKGEKAGLEEYVSHDTKTCEHGG
jgi:hypothetical protein